MLNASFSERWLEETKKMTVLIEPEVQKREAPHLRSYIDFLEDVPLSNKVDFIITLGGDGVRLPLALGPHHPGVKYACLRVVHYCADNFAR